MATKTKEKQATIKLNAWEILAIEKALELLKDSGQAHYTSIDLLLEKMRSAKI